MKHDIRQIILAAVLPLFILFILYLLKFLEVGMDWDFRKLGIYPMEQRGVFGIFAHPFVHSSWKHLLANTLPLFFLSWCLFYFYRQIASYIFFAIWIGGGALTFLLGKPGWHIGASGIIYGLAFFLFFQWHSAETCTADCYILINSLSLWRACLEYVPLLCQRNDFLGRASQRCHSRYALCIGIHGIWTATDGPVCRRRRRGGGRKRRGKWGILCLITSNVMSHNITCYETLHYLL